MTYAYNMDCMEAMRTFPDNFFDLAVVDPPYGSGNPDNSIGGGSTGRDSEADSISTAQPLIHRGGRHGKQKYHLGSLPAKECQTAGRIVGLRELEASGRRSLQKNHSVGHSAGRRIFQRAFPCLTKPDYLGRQLLCTSTHKMFPCVA